MSTVRSTFSTLLSTVSQGANVVTGGLNSAVLGMDMLNQRVKEAHATQQELLILEAMNRTNKVVETHAKEEVTRREELKQWLGQDEARAKAYNEVRAEMLAKLEEAKKDN